MLTFRGSNAHVASSELSDVLYPHRLFERQGSVCSGQVYFPLLNLYADCKGLLGIWPTIDFAIIEIEVPPEKRAVFEGLAVDINTQWTPENGEKLATFGFGSALNPYSELTGDWSQACKVLSDSGDTRLIEDPDENKPAPRWFKVFSFAHGCANSWGDSGAPLVNQATGEFRGIGWTNAFPIPRSLTSEDPWKIAAFAVPAYSIKEIILHPSNAKNINNLLDGAPIIRSLFRK